MEFTQQSNADGYSQLTDDQLRSAIRFAEKRMRWADEDHLALLRAYRDEIVAMRRHLFDRLLSRLITTANIPTLQREAASKMDSLLLANGGTSWGTREVDEA